MLTNHPTSHAQLADTTSINFGAGDVPWLRRINADKNDTIHLSAANGLPVASYESLLGVIGEHYSLTAMNCRGAWPKRSKPPRHFKISSFADDLIAALDSQHSQPVIGMGHSHGAMVTLAAAIKRPDLFNKLVLIEGASMPSPQADAIYQLIPKELLLRFYPLIRGTRQRQTVWPSREAFYDRYRKHNTFKRFTETDLRAYAEHGLFKREDGQFELVFDPRWEAHIFCNVRFLWSFLKKVNLPTLLIRAEYSTLYSRKNFALYNQDLGPHIEPIELLGTHHLLTHEKPELVANTVLDWLGR